MEKTKDLKTNWSCIAGVMFPDQVWKNIFDFLPLSDSSNASMTCTKWHKLVWSSMHDLSVPNKYSQSSVFSDRSLEWVCVQCCNLRTLDLSGVNGITDAGLQAVGRLTSLRHLNISRCSKITAEGLISAISKLDSLQTLNIAWCNQFTDELFLQLSQNPLLVKSLSHLDASFLSQLSNLACTDYLVNFTNVRHLSLNGCERLSRKAVNQLIAHLPKLETLEVRWIQFKEPRRQASPLFASPLRSSSSAKPLMVSYVPLTKEVIPRMTSLLTSANPQLQLEVVAAFRKLLSMEIDPPIDHVIASGAVPKLIHHLQSTDPLMQLESAWALTNIASGTSVHTKVIIDNGALPIFVKLAESEETDVAAQAIWTLGNIAGDSIAMRDLVLEHNALAPVFLQIENALDRQQLQLLRNATWCLSNLCRGSPRPPFDLFSPALPLLANLIAFSDEEVVIDALWAASYLSDGPADEIDEIIEAGIADEAIKMLGHPSVAVITPALRTTGNIATGSDVQTQDLISLGVLPSLLRLLAQQQKKSILKETCWTISNITAGPPQHIQAVIESNIFVGLIHILKSSTEYEVKKEAAWAIGNATIAGNSQQMEYLVSVGCIHELFEFLGHADSSVCSILLDALKNIIRHNKPKYLDIVRSLGKTIYLEELAHSENDDLCIKALDMISWVNGKS